MKKKAVVKLSQTESGKRAKRKTKATAMLLEAADKPRKEKQLTLKIY